LGSKYFIPICLACALAIRICWILFAVAQPVSDYAWYYETATRMLEGNGYSRFALGWMPTAYHAVGYPAFLSLLFAVFGPSVLVGKIANVILYMGILLLTYHLAKTLFHSEIVGRTALGILSFYPNHIAYCSLLAAEILALFLSMSAIALFIAGKPRLWKAVLSGMIFGLACLVRAEVAFLPAVLFGAALVGKIREKSFRRHLLFLAVVCSSLALTILPWEIRNYKTFSHVVFITTHGGINLFIGNNPHATGTYFSDGEAAPMLGSPEAEYERDAEARTLALRYIKEHPLRTIKLWPKKLYYMYLRDIDGVGWTERGMGVWIGTAIGSEKKGTIAFFRGCKILA
jgi:4-amino-4-deoxy-L-arabinose transferase-like glycosyltransferase